jgi:hypothetical protein
MTDSTEQPPQRDRADSPEAIDGARSRVPFTGTEDEFLAHYWSFVGELSPSETMWRSPAQFSASVEAKKVLTLQPQAPQALSAGWLALLFSRAKLTRFGTLVIVGVLITQIACNLGLKGIERSSKP